MLFAILLLVSTCAAMAQTALSTVSRLTGDWRSSASTVLETSATPLYRAGTDLGAAPASRPLARMILLLASSTAQQQALDQKLADLAQSSSSSWLTPAQFAASYANSASDVAAVVSWLKSAGFTVAPLPVGRGWIEFSGSAAQVEQAFGAEVHLVSSGSVVRPALSGSISVPSALAPLVEGLVSLDGVLSTPAVTTPQTVESSVAELSDATTVGGAEALTPKLVAQLLHLTSLHAAGVKGGGRSIAVVARGNVLAADVAAFRAAFSLPASTLKVLPAGDDPGLGDDRAAATLMASWAGVAAPGAQILLVPAASTASTDGVDLALASVVDGALASTVVVGYSSCEASLSAAHQAFYRALYRQAAAEGISIIAATGDSGPAACSTAGSTDLVSTGYAVNALASTAWNTAVGASALATANATALAAWSPSSESQPAYAGGGGRSSLYAEPSWQKFAQSSNAVAQSQASTTAQRMRTLPDLALPAAGDANLNAGLAFCLADSASAASSSNCTLRRAGGSAAAASLVAGIGALLDGQYGAQGNLTPRLYALESTSGVYEDVAEGSAQLWCSSTAAGCSASGRVGFAASAGYDLATGLGSINAQALVSAWPYTTGTTASTVTWSTASQTITVSDALTLKVTVSSGDSSVTSTPTGTVTFYDETESTTLGTVTLSSGVASLTLSKGTLASGVSHILYAIYNGSTVYATATSSTITIVVSAKIATTTTVSANVSTVSPGGIVVLTATVTPDSQSTSESYPTGTVEFFSGTTLIGSATLTEIGSSDQSTASISLSTSSSSLPSGTDSITAVYLGDSYYATSTSASTTITVQDFTITAVSTSPNLTIVKGGTGSASFLITGLGGYTGKVQVICAVSTADDMTCTPTPQQITPTGTVTFVVTTFASGTSTSKASPFLPWRKTAGGASLALAGLLVLPFGRRLRRRFLARADRAFLLLFLLTGLVCSGVGCTSSTAVTSSSSGTPLGVATLKITATNYVDTTVISRSTYLTVNVVKSE